MAPSLFAHIETNMLTFYHLIQFLHIQILPYELLLPYYMRTYQGIRAQSVNLMCFNEILNTFLFSVLKAWLQKWKPLDAK
jgi:hypothetical protein